MADTSRYRSGAHADPGVDTNCPEPGTSEDPRIANCAFYITDLQLQHIEVCRASSHAPCQVRKQIEAAVARNNLRYVKQEA